LLKMGRLEDWKLGKLKDWKKVGEAKRYRYLKVPYGVLLVRSTSRYLTEYSVLLGTLI
jgi:hypothetical protein